MSDAVTIALIVGIPSTLAAIASLISAWKIGRVETKVDGNLSEVKAELKATTAALLNVTSDAKFREGVTAGKSSESSVYHPDNSAS